ncbi:MAG: single-stranded DNA-binding protein, partial [Bdellovibrionota bacterium]
MTNNVNKIILVGHLGHTPELKITQGGRSMLQFSLATNTEFKNAAGGTTKEVHWHRAKVWGKRAEGL